MHICARGDSSEIKFTNEFFETFPEWSLPSTVLKTTIKMIGRHSCLRDVTDQSYPIYGLTCVNHTHYSSVQVIFCSSLKHNLLKEYLVKNLTGRKCLAYGTISYEIRRKITPFKMTWT